MSPKGVSPWEFLPINIPGVHSLNKVRNPCLEWKTTR
jgi:hypothetical protein